MVNFDKRTIKKANPSAPHCPGWSKAIKELSALLTADFPPQQIFFINSFSEDSFATSFHMEEYHGVQCVLLEQKSGLRESR